MQTHTRRKAKWTVSLNPVVSEAVESYLEKQSRDKKKQKGEPKQRLAKLNRSSLIEEALEHWLCKQNEEDERAYYEAHAAELNDDSKSWSRITTAAARHIFK